MPNYVKNIVTVSEETMNKIKEKYFKGAPSQPLSERTIFL